MQHDDDNSVRTYNVNIKIDFAALSDLVAYLKEREAGQGKIDELAAKITELTGKLQTSSTGLHGSVESNPNR